jgi:hypothetical protein
MESSLPLHEVREGECYLLCVFLVGAYQEILGDIHNLFGDTDAVNVDLAAEGGYRLVVEPRHGDTEEQAEYLRFLASGLEGSPTSRSRRRENRPRRHGRGRGAEPLRRAGSEPVSLKARSDNNPFPRKLNASMRT